MPGERKKLTTSVSCGTKSTCSIFKAKVFLPKSYESKARVMHIISSSLGSARKA